jgi:hypothetical protein
MIVMERPETEVSVRSGYEAELVVERADISFHDLPGGKVRIEVTVHNTGERRSSPTLMMLESAPLGAFVPWQPLARLVVPALDPGEARELSTEVPRSRPATLGDFKRVPPKRLLTSVTAPDRPSPPSRAGLGLMVNLLLRGRTGRGSLQDWARRGLAPDLWELVGRGQPYWAGNINVFIGKRAVERHMAKALRVYPGRVNLAMFMVGNYGKQDGYAFELVGLSPDWKAYLCNVTNNGRLLVDPSDLPIAETRWVESSGGLMVMLVTRPPEGCETGNVEVHVTQRSTDEKAIVEFSLDPKAQGSGCYVA